MLAAEQMFQKSIALNATRQIQADGGIEMMDPSKVTLLAYTQLAHCQRKQEKMDSAIESYSKALELDPHSAELAGLLGKLYYV